MNIVLRKELLSEMVSTVSTALVKNPTLRAHSYITFHTFDNGLLLSASSPEISVQMFEAVQLGEQLAFGVDGFLFAEIVKKLSGETVTLNVSPDITVLKVSSGPMHLNINIVGEDCFPMPHNYQHMNFVPTKGLIECIKSVSYAASVDETRSFLMGVFINETEVVATDGFRLSLRAHENDLTGIIDPQEGTIIPSGAIDKIAKIFKDKELNICADQSSIHLNNGRVAASVRKVAKDYLKYKGIILVDGHDELTVKKEDFISALEFVLVATRDDKTVNLTASNGTLKIWASNDKVSHIEQVIEAQFNNNCDITFDSTFLLDFAKRAKNDTITIEMRGANKQIIIREGNSINVIMPKKRTR